MRPAGGRPLTAARRAPEPWTRVARWVALACLVAVVTLTRRSGAEDVPVPLSLQAELLAKVAGYDKNLKARAGDRVRVLLVERAGDADSQRIVAQLRAALERLPSIADIAHEEIVVPWSGARALAEAVRERRAGIVVLSSGFAGDVDAVRDALTGVDVLSATAVSDYVPRGIVLGSTWSAASRSWW